MRGTARRIRGHRLTLETGVVVRICVVLDGLRCHEGAGGHHPELLLLLLLCLCGSPWGLNTAAICIVRGSR